MKIMALIKCENLFLGYDGEAVVKNLSFQIMNGDYVCIVGENGTGKTTLMKGLLSLISPLKGKIEFSDGLLKNQIGYLPQQSSAQKDFPASVYEVVISGCLNQNKALPIYTKKQREIALQNMERVHILDLKKKCFRELSGGQQQKVLLARALCATKKLLVLDEPVNCLDPIAANEMYKTISDINMQGITVVMVSHDINSAVRHASRILQLNKEDYFFGSTHEYMHSSYGSKFLLRDCPCDDCKHRINHKGAVQ